jgi:hypothetical protein
LIIQMVAKKITLQPETGSHLAPRKTYSTAS